MLQYSTKTWIDSVDLIVKLAKITEIIDVQRLDNHRVYTKLYVETIGTYKNKFLLLDFDGKVQKKGVAIGNVCTFCCYLNAKGLTLFLVVNDIFNHDNKKLSFKKWLNYNLDLIDLQEKIGQIMHKSANMHSPTLSTDVKGNAEFNFEAMTGDNTDGKED